MDIKYFLETTEDYEIYKADNLLIIYLENDTHDINITYDMTTETIEEYEAYNSLTDSSVILSEEDQQEVVKWVKITRYGLQNITRRKNRERL